MNEYEQCNEVINIRGNANENYTYRNVVRDATGNGYDAYGISSSPTMMDTKWSY